MKVYDFQVLLEPDARMGGIFSIFGGVILSETQ